MLIVCSFSLISADDGLEMKHNRQKPVSISAKASFPHSTPELVLEPPIKASNTKPNSLQLEPPTKDRSLDKVDSFVTMSAADFSSPTISQSQQAYAERATPNAQSLPSAFTSDPSDLKAAPKSSDLENSTELPTIDVFVESAADDWFAESSIVSRASKIGVSEDCIAPQGQHQEDIKPSSASESSVEASLEQSPVSESCEFSIEFPPPKSRRRLGVSKSNESISSAGRAEHEYIARQSNAYNTVLGHLYPDGKSCASPPESARYLNQPQRLSQRVQLYDGHRQCSSLSSETSHFQWNYPMQQADASFARVDVLMNRGMQMTDMQARSSQETERRSQSSQRRVSESPYRGPLDGIVHVSRYPSSGRASVCSSPPNHNEWESQHEQVYFAPPQQEAQPFPLKPPPIPFASKPKFVPIYEPNSLQRASLQRHHTMDVYSQANQPSDSSFTNYSRNRISVTRHESCDSYSRTPRVHDSKRSTVIDDRIAIASMDFFHRQSMSDLSLDHAMDSNNSSDKSHTYSISDSQSIFENTNSYPSSERSHNSSLSGKESAYTNSDFSSLFPTPPPPPTCNDSTRKLTQVLGSEYLDGGAQVPPAPLNERPMLAFDFLKSESPMVTRLEYPPSPITAGRMSLSLQGGAGKKVLEMPRGPKKKNSFMLMLKRRKSEMRLGEE